MGAGHIAEFHIQALKRIPFVDIVGVTDLDRAKAEALAGRFGLTVAGSLAELIAAGANVIHVLTPPAHARAGGDRGAARGLPRARREAAGDRRRRLREAARPRARARACRSGVSPLAALRPAGPARARVGAAGALGDVVAVDILRGSVYPPYAGGPLPPQYRTAGYPFRDLGIHGLYLIEAFLGPIEKVDADWRRGGGDPNLAFNEWRALVRCKRGTGSVPAVVRHQADAAPDHHAGDQGRAARRPVPDVPGLARLDAAAQAGRAHRQRVHRFDPAADRRAPQRRRVRAQADPPVPRPARAGRRVLRLAGRRDAAGRHRRRRDLARGFTEKVARAADRDHESAREDSRCRARCRTSSPARRAGSARRWSSGCSPTATGCASWCAGSPTSRATASSTRSATSAIRTPSIARSQGASCVIHVGAAMKGGWLEHQGGTVVGTQNVLDACRKHGVEQLVHISSMSVIDWAGADGDDARRREHAARAARRGARRVHARQARGREAGRRRGGQRACPR